MDHPDVNVVVLTPGISKRTCWFPARYVMVFMISMGLFLVYSMRVNLSVTIIAMVNETAMSGNSTDAVNIACPLPVNSTDDDEQDGEFLWDQVMQGYVLNAFFYGYIVTQIPGGWLSELLNPAWLFGGGIGITALLTLCTAVVARVSLPAFLVLRALEGLAEGVTYPSMYALLARWIPARERSFLVSVCSFGSLLGTIVTLPVAAFLCKHGFAGGWPSVFYLSGLLGCVWLAAWCLLASDVPERHRFISSEECKMIVETREGTFGRHRKVPWVHILTSPPVWICSLIKFCGSWTFYTLLTELPSYLKNVLHFEIEKNGWLNAGLYVSQSVVALVAAYIADRVIERGILGVTATRKILESIGLFGGAACLVGLTFVGCDSVAASALLVASCAIGGALYGCDAILPIDLAPEFAGSIMGLANCVSNLSGIFAPMLVGYLTEKNESLERWNLVFFVAAAVNVFGGLAFLFLGTAKTQPWAQLPSNDTSGDSSALIASSEDGSDDESSPSQPRFSSPRSPISPSYPVPASTIA